MLRSKPNRWLVCGLAMFASMISPFAYADPVGGPQCGIHQVAAYGRNVFRVSFYGGELAGVRVIGDHDTDLDLYVYDEDGNLVASDSDYTDDCIAAWLPVWTGTFKIVVVNRGPVYNEYSIMVG